ncbi:MAG: hypothetical protein H0T73_13675 [Ardenticatenales bacterium]|nr:hypothetical protein [Ardenticatenales bacterium]
MEEGRDISAILSTQALARLAEAIREQGVSVDLGEKGCQVEGEVLSMGCTIVEQRTRASGDFLMNLGFQAVPGSAPALVIKDTVIGVGSTWEAAIDRAVALWMEGVWPVLRAAFLSDSEAALRRFSLEAMNYEANRLVTWQVLAGPLQVVGTDAERLFGQLESSPPFPLLLDELITLLEAQTPRAYWLRLFLSRQPDGTLAGEVRVNHQPWDAGLWALQRFDWPTLPDYAGFRQVILLQPSD